MTSRPIPPDADREAQVLQQLRREAQHRQQGYRDRALKLFPHICASCGREFPPKRLKELTVHHKDGNYKNNPPDGSNWELLCLFCHDHEHEKYKMAEYFGGAAPAKNDLSPSIFSPFEKLDQLLKLDNIQTDTAENPPAASGPDAPEAKDDPSDQGNDPG